MLKSLTSMSLAELLTTIAAWVGLFLSVYTYWRSLRLSLKIEPVVTTVFDDDQRAFTSLRPIPFIPEKDERQILSNSALGVRITNFSLFPVYVYKISLINDPEHVVQFPKISLFMGSPIGKNFSQDGCLMLPFRLEPRETVVIKEELFSLSAKQIEQLLSLQLDRMQIETANGHIESADIKTDLKELLSLFRNANPECHCQSKEKREQ